VIQLKKPEAANKAAAFVAGGVKTVTAPRAKARRFDQDEVEMYLKIMLFGNPGTGKTYVVKSLLELGFKVLVITTDVGGDGLNAIIIPMRAAGTWNKFKGNLRSVELGGYETVKEFFNKPEDIIPDIYDFDPDFIFWDGMSGWQQIDVSQYVGDMTPERAGSKTVSDARESGLQFEQADWGQVRNATIRGIDDFCSMRNPKTGKIFHKIVTCHENVKSKGAAAGGGFVEGKEPLLQGAGGRLAQGAFDIILRTSVVSDPLDEDGSKRKFFYILQPHQNLAAKVRGFNLPPKMEADAGVLITDLFRQMGLTLPTVE